MGAIWGASFLFSAGLWSDGVFAMAVLSSVRVFCFWVCVICVISSAGGLEEEAVVGEAVPAILLYGRVVELTDDSHRRCNCQALSHPTGLLRALMWALQASRASGGLNRACLSVAALML